MTVTVKSNTPLTVPAQLQRRAGFKPGNRVTFKVSRGIINIVPDLPSPDDECTPAQRRIIDAEIKDARKGPYYGPFATADEAIKFLRRELRHRRAAERKTT